MQLNSIFYEALSTCVHSFLWMCGHELKHRRALRQDDVQVSQTWQGRQSSPSSVWGPTLTCVTSASHFWPWLTVTRMPTQNTLWWFEAEMCGVSVWTLPLSGAVTHRCISKLLKSSCKIQFSLRHLCKAVIEWGQREVELKFQIGCQFFQCNLMDKPFSWRPLFIFYIILFAPDTRGSTQRSEWQAGQPRTGEAARCDW